MPTTLFEMEQTAQYHVAHVGNNLRGDPVLSRQAYPIRLRDDHHLLYTTLNTNMQEGLVTVV